MSRLLGILLLAAACGQDSAEIPAEPSMAHAERIAAVDDAVARVQLSVDDQVWRKIAWEEDYESARQRSQQQDRPIFFFSMWGELDGRC